MIIAILLGSLIQFNERPHPTGKTFCERHLIDDYPTDENGKEIEPRDDDDDKH